MANCKEDFLNAVKEKELLCAEVEHGQRWSDEEPERPALLPTGFSEAELNNFLKSIDYEYDDGFGGQEVFGTIWYKDGTWSERGEYDGSEWWEYKQCPAIPDKLRV